MQIQGRGAARVALVSTALAFGWQWLIVAGYFGGHWSALFLTGDGFPHSPAVIAESTYLLPNSVGYDGQHYHAMAHDPLNRNGTGRFLDDARFRYVRILMPALSHVLGFGQLFWIDRAYRALELAAVFLGVFSVACFASIAQRSVWWGAAFLALPATFISLERELVDLPLCALLAAALLARERGRLVWCWIALAAAGLDREMGIVAAGGLVLAALYRRRIREAAVWASANLPAVAWSLFVIADFPGSRRAGQYISYPFSALIFAVRHPFQYPFPPATRAVLISLDWVAIAGALAAFVLVGWILRSERDELAWTGAILAAFAVVLTASPVLDYRDVYSFARQNSPLLLIQLIQAIRAGKPGRAAPLAAMLPRSLVPGTSMTLRAVLHLF